MSVRPSADTEGSGGVVGLDEAGRAPARRVPWSARGADRPWPPATHRLLLATGVLLALGTFWTVLSMPDLAYHPARDLELRATYDSYLETGVPLVKENGTGSWYGALPGEGLTKAAGDDDPGSYLVASWMSHLTRSASPYPGLRWAMALLCALPMLILPVTVARIFGRARAGMAMLALPLLTWLVNDTVLVGTEYGLSDKVAGTPVYALYGLPASLIFLSLVVVAYAVTRRPGVRAAIGWTILLVLLAAWGNLLRSLSGFGIALSVGVLWWVAWRARMRWAAACAAAVVGVIATVGVQGLAMDRIEAQRQAVVLASTDRLMDAHGIWHSPYLGLSYPQPITGEPSPFGVQWSDDFGVLKAREVDPSAMISTPEYDAIIKDIFLAEVTSAPWTAARLYLAKTVYTLKHFAAMLLVILAAAVLALRRPGVHRATLRQVSAATVPILLLGLIPAVVVMPMLYYYIELSAALGFLLAVALGGLVWVLTTLPSVVRTDERARALARAQAVASERQAGLTVVVPTRSGEALSTLDAWAGRLGIDDEVVVVRKDTSDVTAGGPDSSAATWDQPARLVVLDSEPGLGHALRAGVLASRGARVLLVADDCALDPTDVEALTSLGDSVVLAVGTRPDASRTLSWLRRALLHSTVEDGRAAYWVDGRWVRSFAAVSRETGDAWTAELVLAAEQQGIEVWEVPVTARGGDDARRGGGRLRDRFVALKELVGLAVRRDDYAGQQWPGGVR